MVPQPQKIVHFSDLSAENRCFSRKFAIFPLEHRHFFAEAFSGHEKHVFRPAHKCAKSEKCAKRKNALNRNALSGALNDIDKVDKVRAKIRFAIIRSR